MAVHFGVSGVRSLITGVLLGAIEFPAPLDCRLNRLFLQIAAANAEGDTLFDVKVNGESIYGSPLDRPKILAGETISESFPSVDLVEGDIVSVDVVGAPLGGISGLYIIVQLQDAPTIDQYVRSAYLGALGRQPDSTELANGISGLNTGCGTGGTATLAATRTFLGTVFTSAEYIALTTTNAEFIEDVYNAVLGRLSDPGGFAFWSLQMTGGMTRSVVLDNFNACIEHQNIRVQPWCPQMPLVASANKLQNTDVSLTAPSVVGQALVWDGSSWGPATLDFLSSAFDIKDPEARAATTAALPAYTGSAGVLTATSNGALTAQDGVTLVANDSLLVKNETGGSEKWNGLYTVTQVGDGSHPFILTRRSDANTSAKVTPGMMARIGNEGTANKNTMWWLTISGPVTLNTTALTFTQFGASGGPPTGSAGGDLTGTYPNPTLAAAGAGAATYGGGGDFVESVTLDSKGRVTAVTTDTPSGGGGGGGPTMVRFINPDGGIVPGYGLVFRPGAGSASEGCNAADTYAIGNRIGWRVRVTGGPDIDVGFDSTTSNAYTHPGFSWGHYSSGQSYINHGSGSFNAVSDGAHAIDDFFEIEITATQFKFYKNGSLRDSFTTTTTGSWYFVISFEGAGAAPNGAIYDVRVIS
jgi:Domain of unknown function (DUF4214)